MRLPPLTEILRNAIVVDLRLVKSFRGMNHRSALLFEGPAGWAEFAPFQNHDVAHASRWLSAAVEQAYGTWATAAATWVPVNAILPEISVSETASWVERLFASGGFTTFKFKSAPDFSIDLQRIAAIKQTAEQLGFQPKLRLDVNGNWNLQTALANLSSLVESEYAVEYVEQPVSSLADLALLRQRVQVPIAVDESLRLVEVPDYTTVAAVADYAIVKAIPLGGVAAATEVVQRLGIPAVVSGSLDTSVGLAAGIQLAASLAKPLPAGLATDYLFADQITSAPHKIQNGQIEVKRAIPDLASSYRADASTTLAWQARLTECYEFLEQQ